jgi:hypothetical protein
MVAAAAACCDTVAALAAAEVAFTYSRLLFRMKGLLGEVL